MEAYSIEDFPGEAIEDCTGPGPADEAVAYWVDKLNFRPDPDAARACLKEYGAWDAAELADNEQNRRRLLWAMFGDFSEWDGTSDSPSGCDVFYV